MYDASATLTLSNNDKKTYLITDRGIITGKLYRYPAIHTHIYIIKRQFCCDQSSSCFCGSFWSSWLCAWLGENTVAARGTCPGPGWAVCYQWTGPDPTSPQVRVFICDRIGKLICISTYLSAVYDRNSWNFEQNIEICMYLILTLIILLFLMWILDIQYLSLEFGISETISTLHTI